jgi:gamma-glutamylcyclotransferase (GGCT)/AIG2-like uncharacterized protein YtfP
MEEISNFVGHIVAIERDQSNLSVRMVPLYAFNGDIKPVLTVSVCAYDITDTSAPSLEEVKENEYEIQEVEIEKENDQLSLWIYDYDEPIIIKGKSIAYEFSGLEPNETHLILSNSRKAQDEQYKQIVELRKNFDAIGKFIIETETRIKLKSTGHPEGTVGYRLFHGQLELLNRIKNILNT